MSSWPHVPAACSDEAVTIDVLVRLTAAVEGRLPTRPALNLGLVIDRSGSMAAGRKLEHAKQAAIFAVEQLLPTDRVSVTAYDSDVNIIVPSTTTAEKDSILAQVRAIQPGSATALHAGWKAGATQVIEHARPGMLNRVLLLSDGLANQGLSDPTAIADEARQVAEGGVSTTTLGVGDDYNEDLMESMARQGHGNYYFIEDPAQLADIFQTELHDLMALVGHRVSLGIEPSTGVQVVEILNDFDRLNTGRWKLPNLVAGSPIRALVRLRIEPRPGRSTIAAFRLAWDVPKGDRRTIRVEALELPSVSKANWERLDQERDVIEQAGLLMSARARREAALAMERGEHTLCQARLETAWGITSALPTSAGTVADLSAIQRLADDLAQNKIARFLKRTKQQVYGHRHGKDLS
ncbi:MAG: VWA domain-containing protein [Isosphaeraceae bacterium]